MRKAKRRIDLLVMILRAMLYAILITQALVDRL
jgi:hypothetical protein